MAKLTSYDQLCRLIEGQNILGIEKDADNGCAIVTLGKKIAFRFKLQDFRQLGSWSTTERFTTQVIYESKTNRYAAVFNDNQIRVWNEQDSKLDDIKRYKFNNPFNTILSCDNGEIIVVRYDGATASLQWALNNRKTWKDNGFLKSNEKLSDCRLITINNKTYLCGLIRTDTTCNYITIGLHDDTYLIDYETIKKIELKRISEQLVGHVIIKNNNNAYLLTLWSHGRLYSYQLINKTNDDKTPGTLISVLSSISKKQQVLMIALNESTIAAYGANIHDEGAVLLIYNIQFKLIQAIETFKLHIKDTKLWCIDDKLLLTDNINLRIVSYRLASPRIETMLGSSLRFKNDDKKDNDNDIIEIQETILANWQDDSNIIPKKFIINGIPKDIAKQINIYLNDGVSDAVIQKSIIPKLIETKDISTILWFLDNLNDQPENIIVDLLSFALRTSDDTFKLSTKQQKKQQQNGTPNKKINKITRNDFLDKLFKSNFYDLSLLNYLKTELTFNEVLRLVNYIIDKFNNNNNNDNDTNDYCQFVGPNDKQLYEWASLLLDSHYQHYLLSQDPTVLTMLNKLDEILSDHHKLLKEFEDLRPMFHRLSNGKPVKLSSTDFNKFYSIEEIQLC